MIKPWNLVCCLLAALSLPVDEADDRAVYIDGLHARQLHSELIVEAQSFLDAHPEHERADLVRYRLASALFELERLDEAAPLFRVLAQRPTFGWRAEASLRLGQCELASDRLDAAVAAFDAARRGEAELRTPATFLMAEAHLRADRFADALPLYDEVLASDPQGDYAVDAAAGRAWCCHRLQRHGDALTTLDGLLARGVNRGLALELQFLRGESLLALDRPADAERAYAEVDAGPFADAALRGSAFAAVARERHGEAAARFEALLARFPDSRFVPEAAFQLGVQRLLAGDASGAWNALASPAVPASAEARYWQARAAGELGQSERALTLLSQAEALGPDATLEGHVQSARGDLLASSGRAAEAAAAYARAGSPASLHAAAVASLNAGDADGALALVERVLDAGGDGPAVRLTRGEALFAGGRSDLARPDFEAALRDADAARALRARSRLAWCDYLAGDLVAAGAGFRSLIERAPDAPEAEEARFMVGRCEDERGEVDVAAEAWRLYLERHPSGAHATEARLGLGRLLPPADRVKPLRDAADHGSDPEQVASALLQLGDVLAELGRPDEAAAAYARLIDEHGASSSAPAARYGLAWLLVDGGDPAQALAALAPLLARPSSKAPAVEPELRTAAHELAVWCHCVAGDAAAAERALDALVALQPGTGRVLASARSVAAAWTSAGRADRAQRLMDGLASASPAALVEAAWIALDAGHVDEADARVRQALEGSAQSPAAVADDPAAEVAPDLAEVAFFVAEAHFAAGRDAAAIPLYDAAVDGGGELADEALYKSGFARLRSDDPAGAAERFDTLVAQHADSPLAGESLFLAGEAFFRLGRYDDATRRLSRLLAEQPGHAVAPKARFRLGLSLAQLEQWQAAADTLADLARRHPQFENLLEAELWRGRALANLGNERGARAALERVVAEDRGVLAARARLELGRLYLAGGDNERALSEFLKLVVLHADGPEVAEALLLAGDCLAAQGRAADAAARWRELIERHPDSTHAAAARQRLRGV